MRIPLKVKMMGAFAAIILLSLAISVGSGNRLTRSRYQEYSLRADNRRAQVLAQMIGRWTDEVQPAGATEPYLAPLALSDPSKAQDSWEFFSDPEDHKGSAGQILDRMDERFDRDEDPGLDRLIVTDIRGNVLLDTAGYGHTAFAPNENNSVPIRAGQSLIGYISVGRMLPGISSSIVGDFTRSIGIATWLIAGGIFILALLLGWILSHHIVVPVLRLNRASERIGAGIFEARVPETRKDELGDLSRSFNIMGASLEAADSQRRRLIADSAHELRTPVSLIKTRIEMIEEGVYPMNGESLNALSAEAGRLALLVDDLGVLANLEAPDSRLSKEDISIWKFVAEAVEAVSPVSRNRSLTVETDIAENAGLAKGNRSQLFRMLGNLLSNAQRYAESKILIRVKARPETIVFSVEDDGPGIPPNDWEKIFERYYRGDSSRNRESGGSGLGLAICREIIHVHRGQIQAGSSETLGGTAIRAEIPRD